MSLNAVTFGLYSGRMEWAYTLPIQKESRHFDLNQQIVALWFFFSWSGLGTASQRSSWMYWMTKLNDQWIFFFPDGIFQDDNAKIYQALVVKEWSMRTHECQGARGVIFTHELATTESWLFPINSLCDVLGKTEGMVRLSFHQDKISAKNECNSWWK